MYKQLEINSIYNTMRIPIRRYMNKVVKKIQVNPNTGKRSLTICVQTDIAKTENFHWNNIYHVYNSIKDYHQLMTEELKHIVW
jgi:hypothetical protein